MKRVVNLLIASALISAMLIGCSAAEPAASQKSAEELKAEIKAEMEAEAKEKAEMEAEIRAELETEQRAKEANEEQQKPEAAKGQQEDNKAAEAPKTVEKPQPAKQPEAAVSALIESDKASGYYKYKANTPVSFDINGDGKNEEIKYDSANGNLSITGHEAVDIDTMFAQRDYFIIIEFKDKYNTQMNMIGVIDYGPSSDVTTALYSVIAPNGKEWFGSVGTVPGEIVPPSKYNGNSNLDDMDDPNVNAVMDDFNYKAVLRNGEGIEAPVRMSVLPFATWFGRNTFTYYSTYCRLIDNIEKYNQDYETIMVLNLEKDVKAYSEKDINSGSVTIKAGQKVYILGTDNKEWIAMVSEDENMGWVSVKDVSEETFSGYPVFD